jgi:type VI secretion system protein ImpB
MSVQEEIPRSRLTLTYRTTVNGEPEVVDLPLRLMVLGDFSAGSSQDRQVDLEERQLRSINGNNLPHVMKDMGIRLNFEVKNRINPADPDETLAVDLPIERINSFSPDEVAKSVPKIRALLLLRQLLQELQTNVSNRKAFRKQLKELFEDPAALKQVREELAQFKGFQIPETLPAPAGAGEGATENATEGAAEAPTKQ